MRSRPRGSRTTVGCAPSGIRPAARRKTRPSRERKASMPSGVFAQSRSEPSAWRSASAETTFGTRTPGSGVKRHPLSCPPHPAARGAARAASKSDHCAASRRAAVAASSGSASMRLRRTSAGASRRALPRARRASTEQRGPPRRPRPGSRRRPGRPQLPATGRSLVTDRAAPRRSARRRPAIHSPVGRTGHLPEATLPVRTTPSTPPSSAAATPPTRAVSCASVRSATHGNA